MQGRECANRGLSAHWHKDRSLDFTACETKRSSTCIAVLAVYRKWDRAGHGKQANLLATLGVLSMKLWPLLLLGFLGCSGSRVQEPDSASPGLSPNWEREFNTEEDRFHVVLSPDPDPAERGPFVLGMRLSRNSDNPTLDGALLVNAGVHVSGEQPAAGGDLGGDIQAEELGAGVYEASWSFAHSGVWHLQLEIGAGEDMDIALIGLLVED